MDDAETSDVVRRILDESIFGASKGRHDVEPHRADKGDVLHALRHASRPRLPSTHMHRALPSEAWTGERKSSTFRALAALAKTFASFANQ